MNGMDKLRLIGFTRACLLLGWCCVLALAACGTRTDVSDESSPATDFRSHVAELTQTQARVLGFEQPTADWSSSSAAISSSSVVTEGSVALSVVPNGWTEIDSIALTSLGSVNNTLTVDVRAPVMAPWGEFRVIVRIPSQNVYKDLGGVALNSLTVGQYKTLSFTLDGPSKAALVGTYSDLSIRLVFNAQPGLGAFLVDNLRVAQAAPPGGGSGSSSTLSIAIPPGETLQSLLLSATHNLQIDSRVELGAANTLTVVGNASTQGARFESASNVHANVYSVGLVSLYSQTKVDGFVRTKQPVWREDNSVSFPSSREQILSDIPFATFQWPVEFPPAPQTLPTVTAQNTLSLPPGNYTQLEVAGGAVYLSSGFYYFDGPFTTTASSQVHVNLSNGPLVIYVKGNVAFYAPFVRDAGSEGQVLVGHFGSNPVIIEAPFSGTVVSPSGGVELRRPSTNQYKGAFFGKSVRVFSHTQVLPLAFDFDSLGGGAPDLDGDFCSDTLDLCPFDPNKCSPGICNCHFPDDLDQDLDKVPDCVDQCPLDPKRSEPGSCGCIGDESLKTAGAKCRRDECPFSLTSQVGTCDGNGTCSAPSCEPLPGCQLKQFRGHFYWFCNTPVTWQQARDACGSHPTRHLAKVDDRIENEWLSRVATGSMWLGGNDAQTEGEWYWASTSKLSGKQFWHGASNGSNVNYLYTNWAPSEPGPDDCLVLDDSGTWSDANCATLKGFICENPPHGGGNPPPAWPPVNPYPADPGAGGAPPIDDRDSGGRETDDATNTGSSTPQTVSDPEATGGEGTRFTNGSTDPNNSTQRLRFTFYADQPRTFQIWVRHKAPNADSDSFFARVNDGPFIRANDYAVANQWTWRRIHNSDNGGQPMSYPLAAGWHTVDIVNREAGFELDAIWITATGGTPPTPPRDNGPRARVPDGLQECVSGIFPEPEDPTPPYWDADEELLSPLAPKYENTLAQKQACDQACEDHGDNSQQCLDACNSSEFTQVPKLGARCDSFSASEVARCEIEEFNTTPCESNAQCSGAFPICGRRTACADVEERVEACGREGDPPCSVGFLCYNNRCARGCDDASDCPGAQVACISGLCVDYTKTKRCDDAIPSDDPSKPECIGICFTENRCGKINPLCANNQDSIDVRCDVTRMCHPRAAVGEPIKEVDALQTDEFDVEEAFPEPVEPPLPFGEAVDELDCGRNGVPCQYGPGGSHPWCKLGLQDYLTSLDHPADPNGGNGALLKSGLSDMDPQFGVGGDKKGSAKRGDLVSFDFDPQLEMDYNVEAKPFGEVKFDVGARAGASAYVDFNLFNLYKGRVSVLDAFGELRAKRCGFSADARLALMGVDFLPDLMGTDNYDALTQFNTEQASIEACEKAIEDYERAVNRAKKALRDAQELVRQYRLLTTNGQAFAEDLCQQLLGQNVPEKFLQLINDAGGCTELRPHEVINLFIDYYRLEILELIRQQAAMLTVGVSSLLPQGDVDVALPELPPDYADLLNEYAGEGGLQLPYWRFSIPFLEQSSDEERRESQQVANITFAIGPVPMNLTVDVFYAYGMDGALQFEFMPGNLLVAYRNSGQQQNLVNVSAGVTPWAGAGVTLFLGVGFDFGPLSAKLGISGDVSLGMVQVPITAGAGVSVVSVNDERPLPADLAGMIGDTPTVLFPPGGNGLPQKFNFEAGYKLDARLLVNNILSGSIDARLKIKFFFFSKTWSVNIVKFNSFVDPIDLTLFSLESGFNAEFDLGPLGGFQMPLPFLDLAKLPEPPPLPPLPPGDHLPPPGEGPSLAHVEGHDPRYAGIDPTRVEQLFYDGFCEVQECQQPIQYATDIDSCPSENPLCSVPPKSTEEYDAEPTCTSHQECCGWDNADAPSYCGTYKYTWEQGESEAYHCQPCRKYDEPPMARLENGQWELGGCCPEAPHITGLLLGENILAVCTGECRGEGDRCYNSGYFPQSACCGGLVCQGGICVEAIK